MSRRRKPSKGYFNAILLLLVMVVLYKIGGVGLLMILFTLGIGVGAIYLSGESLSSIFRRKVEVSSLDELIRMNPYDFEKFVGNYFKSCGYTVHQTSRSNDGGKDLIMYKGGQTYYVEVKRYAKNNSVSRPLIQKLVGACHPAGANGIFVTTSYFSDGAISEARRSNIELIDGKRLMQLLNS